MVIFFAIKLKDLFEKGRDYPWPKPKNCPCCHSHRLWGHGFAEAIFDGYKHPLVLKLYRCPDCGCVIRIRPKGYFKRFQASIKTIRFNLSYRLKNGRWPGGLGRCRQGHWLRALRRKVEAYLGKTWQLGLMEAFDHLLAQGHNPVSRSI